jgi:hypothetical protein
VSIAENEIRNSAPGRGFEFIAQERSAYAAAVVVA